MQSMGVKYKGCLLNGRMDDPDATYKFTNYFSSEYQGGIKDGMFHGEGKLKFSGGILYFEGKFEKGKAVEGYYEFKDGLRVAMKDWDYCDGVNDRLFKSEEENGLKPAGRSQLANLDPPPVIPEGMYDCGDGFYDPVTRKIINYDKEFLRNTGSLPSIYTFAKHSTALFQNRSVLGLMLTDEKEHNWIVNHCRKAWDEPVSTRKIH